MSRLPLQQFRFKGTPLFGVDSSPHFTSKILGIAGTVFFWLIFLLCMCLIRFKEKEPEFKEVKIILSSTPLQEVEVDTAPALAASAAQSAESAETQASAEAALQPAEQIAVEQPAPAKPVEKPVEKAPPKTEQVQSKPAAQQKPATQQKPAAQAKTETVQKESKTAAEPFVPSARDMSGEIDFGEKTSSAKKEFDWSIFDDDSDVPENQNNTSGSIVTAGSSVAGTAGTATDKAQNQKQESKSTSTGSQQSSASSNTKNALQGIAEAKFHGQAANGVTSETAVKAKLSGNGQYLMEMKGGSFRCLIYPAEPKIDLSEAACKTVNSNIDVTISFTVTQGGQISEASIIFSPASILSEIVKKEIKETLQTWLFEAAPNTSQASFEYHIKKK